MVDPAGSGGRVRGGQLWRRYWVPGLPGRRTSQLELRWMQAGIGLFLLANPLDLLNHKIYGLDITSWSPTHAVLYLGTAVMLVGTIRAWWLYAAPGRLRTGVLLALWAVFLENVLFPNQHQQYGVLSLQLFREASRSPIGSPPCSPRQLLRRPHTQPRGCWTVST